MVPATNIDARTRRVRGACHMIYVEQSGVLGGASYAALET